MTGAGLVAVSNPSAVFLAARAEGTAGSAVTALMEGTRPVLVEVQALAAPSGYGTPQRVATGLDPKRLAVILAVLERRAGASFATRDVFVQVTAGVRLNEPGADLAVAAALLSSMHDRPTPANALFIGELGLGGEVRPIGGLDRRLNEAARLGFVQAFGSARSTAKVAGLQHRGLEHVEELVRALAA
jgi:DNA repair protein RadA/Sms